MDHQSINQFVNKSVRITLSNGFWYRAKIILVTEERVEFIEEKGRKISVTPETVIILEESL